MMSSHRDADLKGGMSRRTTCFLTLTHIDFIPPKLWRERYNQHSLACFPSPQPKKTKKPILDKVKETRIAAELVPSLDPLLKLETCFAGLFECYEPKNTKMSAISLSRSFQFSG